MIRLEQMTVHSAVSSGRRCPDQRWIPQAFHITLPRPHIASVTRQAMNRWYGINCGRVAALWALLLSSSIITPCRVTAQDSLFHESRPAMGTTVEIFLYAATNARAVELFEVAFQEIARVEEALSNYRTTSEISRINSTAADRPVVTDPEVFGLIARSLEYSWRTGGAFDVTVGPLSSSFGRVTFSY